MTTRIKTRSEAIAARSPTYNTGKPCKHGHTSDRSTVDGACLECRLHYHRAYQREQRQQIRDSLRQASEG